MANQVAAAVAQSIVTVRDESPNTLGDSEGWRMFRKLEHHDGRAEGDRA
jgi:hypothetical protein